MDEEAEKEEKDKEWEESERRRKIEDEERTRKKREKRNKKNKKGGKASAADATDVVKEKAGSKAREIPRPRTDGDEDGTETGDQQTGGAVQEQEIGITIHDDD